MSKKLNMQAVDAARNAAAAANTYAHEVLEALRARVDRDRVLAVDLAALVVGVQQRLNGEVPGPVHAEFRAELESTANSYGFTLADHPIRKDLVVVTKIGA